MTKRERRIAAVADAIAITPNADDPDLPWLIVDAIERADAEHAAAEAGGAGGRARAPRPGECL